MHKFNNINITGLDIDSHSDVIVKPCRNIGFTEVEITGSAKNIELISVKQLNDVIYILDNTVKNNSININSSVMNFSGGDVFNISNISMSNGHINIGGGDFGKVTINGKTINLNDLKDDDKNNISTVITIYTGSVDLDLKLSKSSKFISDVAFISSFIEICGSSLIDNIVSRNLEINSSNSSHIEGKVLGGDLLINSSNSSQIITSGVYSSVRVNASNSSDVNTKGHCLGNYRANASNSSYIHNEAKVDGNKSQNVSNSARIRL